MKEDAAAKELESLLREALQSGLAPRAGNMNGQLKTVPLPLPVQSEVLRKAPASSSRASAKKATPAHGHAKVTELQPLAPMLAPESRPPSLAIKPSPVQAMKPVKIVKRSRKSSLALGFMSILALGAACSAAWLAQHRHPASDVAQTAAAQPEAQGTSTEGVVGITVVRPAAATPPVAPETKPADAKVEDTKVAATSPVVKTAAPPPEPKAPQVTSLPYTPPPPVAAPPKHEAAAAKPHHATVAVATPPSPAPPKAEAKPEPEAKKPAPASGGGGSVDALLQQQLKGAIP